MSARRKVVAADQIKIFRWITDYEDFFYLGIPCIDEFGRSENDLEHALKK